MTSLKRRHRDIYNQTKTMKKSWIHCLQHGSFLVAILCLNEFLFKYDQLMLNSWLELQPVRIVFSSCSVLTRVKSQNSNFGYHFGSISPEVNNFSLKTVFVICYLAFYRITLKSMNKFIMKTTNTSNFFLSFGVLSVLNR